MADEGAAKATLFATILLLVAAFVAGCQTAKGTSSSTFTGFLDGAKIDVASQVGGRLARVPAEEGAAVKAGDVLAILDDDFMRARVDAADANIAAAVAQLELLESGPRLEDVRRSEAEVFKARAALASATRALSDTLEIRNNPQTLLVAQAQAEMQMKVAQQQLAAALGQAQSADVIDRYLEQQTRMLWEGFDIYLPGGKLHFDAPARAQVMSQEEWQKAGNSAWQAWAGVQQAQANADAAQAGFRDISEQIDNPIAIDARVDQARGAKARAQAAVQAAEAALQILRNGASEAQKRQARAAVDQARATRATLDVEAEHYRINAPQAGMVSIVYYRPGEVVAPGSPVIRLSVEGDLTLRTYVPMTVLEKVSLGQQVSITVDGIPNRTFRGQVQRTGERAEFSGRQAQTDSERNAQLVLVEIAVVDDVHLLKAGMPASVTFD